MLFHTWVFGAFFLIVWPVYLAVRRTRWREPWLLAASYVFYGWWNPLYLVLIARCTVMDYAAGLLMARGRGRRARAGWLALSVAANLAQLWLFKYAGFATELVNGLLAQAGAGCRLPTPGWLLPVGISFYTFQSMSYTIDCYRGVVGVERSLIRYAAFVALFPQLVAGPIERASHLLPQLRAPGRVTAGGVAEGASLLVVGLFKKLALADYLGLYVDSVYATPWKYGPVPLAAATFAFGWQIYFDFSGYTDMARGIARAMGYRLMLNFNRPYLADSLGDFWRRWHISLSTWFRDYVYVPLGGSRAGKLRTYRNLVLTMLICGLWHGAAWTFVIWGALHAAGQAATRELERSAFYARRVPKLLKQAAVFVFVTFAWIFFRAESVTDAWIIVRRLLLPGEWGRGALEAPFPLAAAGLIAAVWGYQYLSETRVRRVLRPAPVRVGLMVIMLLYLALVGGPAGRPFIYFQF